MCNLKNGNFYIFKDSFYIEAMIYLLFLSIISLTPGDAYMHRWTGSSLYQIMTCHLFGVKPLSDPMSTKPWGTYFSEILLEIHKFSFKKIHLKMPSAKVKLWPFCLGISVLHGKSSNGIISSWCNTVWAFRITASCGGWAP